MDRQGILIIDVGTSKTHANCIDLGSGELLANRTAEYVWQRPKEDWVEIDPEEMWEAAQTVCAEVLDELPGVKICALTFSWFGGNLIVMDRDGNALYPLIVSFDARAGEEARDLSHILTPDEAAMVGRTGLDETCTPAKMLWLKRHLPKVHARIACAGTVEQYFFARMGLPFIGERSMIQTAQMYDPYGKVMAEIAEAAETPADVFSFTRVEGDQVLTEIDSFGRVRFPHRIPVFYGGHDCVVSQLGCGCLPDGGEILGDVSGTYDLMGFLLKREDLVGDFAAGGFLDTPVSGAYSYMDGFPAGAELDRAVEMLWGSCSGELLGRLFDEAVFDGASGGLWDDPGWDQIRRDPGSLGRYGERAVFASLVEEETFRLKDSYLALCEKHRGPFTMLRVGGGGAKSASWLQLKANVFGLPVERLRNMEVSSVGAAMIAAVVLGVYPDYQTAVRVLSQGENTCFPECGIREAYDKLYKKWKNRKEIA